MLTREQIKSTMVGDSRLGLCVICEEDIPDSRWICEECYLVYIKILFETTQNLSEAIDTIIEIKKDPDLLYSL